MTIRRSVTGLSAAAALAVIPLAATAAPAAASVVAPMPTIYTLATQFGGLCAGSLNPVAEVYGPTENPYVGAKVHIGVNLYGFGRCATTGTIAWRNLDTGAQHSYPIWLQAGATTSADIFAPPGRVQVTLTASEAHFPPDSTTEIRISPRA
ncbi:hypothetical protein [Nocardia transvalensis]|uniref:hypothetical protein n=1 Tax=Nocardia transvalensis TaxID=37333 RepID=UPI0018930BEC|nr:hypothetical protein [Nocardia transvalensis]MBF6327757.1 hypothetical protein [Nocardia transvalensis]